MRRPLFTANSASVTVLRSLASSAFGKYDLTIPEGMDPEDFYELAAPDNELAYVASLVHERRVGGLARRFVRADVQVTSKDDTDPDWVASSTVDDVLEEAAERTSGDFFLESDISKAGLNGYEPFVDFTVGDKADVDVWGRYVTLPVTRIQPRVSEHDTSDFLVHLGGQIVSDTDARLAENEEIRRALIEDRRDLAGLEAQVSKAVAAANDAQSTAAAADEKAQLALDSAGGDLSAFEKYLEEAKAAAAAGAEHLANVETAVSTAGAHVSRAEAYVAQALELVDQAEGVLGQNAALRSEITQVHEQITVLQSQIATSASAASADADAAKAAAEHAAASLAGMSTIEGQVSAAVDEAKAAAAAGAQALTDAKASAAAAAVSNTSAKDYADRAAAIVAEADQKLAAAGSAQEDAERVLGEARSELAGVQGTLSEIDTLQSAVLTLHQEAISKHAEVLQIHTEVLSMHGDAIRAAADAGEQAGAAAMYATQAAQDAARAAQTAIDIGNANTRAIELLELADAKLTEATEKNTQAVTLLSDATAKQGEAITLLGAVTTKLEDVQKMHSEQILNLEAATRLHNQAIRAVAAAAASAGAASMQASIAAQESGLAAAKALEAGTANTRAIEQVGLAVAEVEKAQTQAKLADDAKQAAIDEVVKAQSAATQAGEYRDEVVATMSAFQTRFLYVGVNEDISRRTVQIPVPGSPGYVWDLTLVTEGAFGSWSSYRIDASLAYNQKDPAQKIYWTYPGMVISFATTPSGAKQWHVTPTFGSLNTYTVTGTFREIVAIVSAA